MSREFTFARRANNDGTVESICRECFVTIATAHWEAELDDAEHEHICDPADLARFERYQLDDTTNGMN